MKITLRKSLKFLLFVAAFNHSAAQASDFDSLRTLLQEQRNTYKDHTANQSDDEYSPYIANPMKITKIVNLYDTLAKKEPWQLSEIDAMRLHEEVSNVIKQSLLDANSHKDQPSHMIAQCYANIRVLELSLQIYRATGELNYRHFNCLARVYNDRYGERKKINSLNKKGEKLFQNIVKKSANLRVKKCQSAVESKSNIYANCWGNFQNVITLSSILEHPETIKMFNSSDYPKRVGQINALLYTILQLHSSKRTEIDLAALQFAIDLYHTLPPGTAPPPSDITPTISDKGLLWRFDEPLGEFRRYCNSDKYPQMKKLCKYYFQEGNLDHYTKNARVKNVRFPSPNQNKVVQHMGLNASETKVKLKNQQQKPSVAPLYKHYTFIKKSASKNGCVNLKQIIWANYRRDRRKNKKTFDVLCGSKIMQLECVFSEIPTCLLKQ